MDSEGKQRVIKKQIELLITEHSIESSEVDEVVYSYISGLVDESVDEIDMVEFISIMDAYLPGFGIITLHVSHCSLCCSEEVTKFMLSLQSLLTGTPEADQSTSSISGSSVDTPNSQSTKHGRQRRNRRTSSRQNSESTSSRQNSDSTSSRRNSESTNSRQNSESEHHAVTSQPTAHTWSDVASSHTVRSVSESSTEMFDWPGLAQDNSVRPRNDSTRSGSPLASTSSSRTNSECHGEALTQISTAEKEVENMSEQTAPEEEISEVMQRLIEMFPDKCIVDIEKSLKRNNNDLESAVMCLLGDEDLPQEATHLKAGRKTSSDNNVKLTSLTPKGKQRKGQRSRRKSSNSQEESQDSEVSMEKLSAAEMKSLILDKYSYIPTDEESKTFKPKLQTNEEKKMVRYRNGQVVSTKGERFSDVKPALTDEMKKTYINLKPAKQYRFH